eukprot:RCo043072
MAWPYRPSAQCGAQQQQRQQARPWDGSGLHINADARPIPGGPLSSRPQGTAPQVAASLQPPPRLPSTPSAAIPSSVLRPVAQVPPKPCSTTTITPALVAPFQPPLQQQQQQQQPPRITMLQSSSGGEHDKE